MNWKIAILSVFLLLTFGCSKTPPIKQKFHGDYPAEGLRSMWAFCVQNFQMKSPQTPPFLVAQMCDCYIDEMRMSHPHSHINKLSDNETREMGLRLVRVCNVNQSPVQKI